ncbi:LIC_10190 family membrane protein [Dysgonomonas reticulitermitis]
MLAVLFAWIIISFILLSFGDMFISLYNKLCKKNDQYNIPETFMLGICFILVPLSLLSLWFPSNQYMLLLYVIISFGYWTLNRSRFTDKIQRVKETIKDISLPQKTAILLSSCSILLYTLYSICWDDALFYHYQQIEWNETYPVVPGLANLEDRFGFNSNYLLISAIFTFKFLFGEPLYVLQSILFIYVMVWVLKEVIISKFNISRLLLLFIFLFFFSLNAGFLTDSSTDIVPNICAFYYIAKFALYPNFSDKKLFFFILPIMICTFKMSIFPLCLLSIYILFLAIKDKRKSQFIFFVTFSFSIVSLWLIRNVIISGYLVYPLHELDLFSFEWKIPKGISMIQREIAMAQFAKGLFKDYITFYFFERSGFWTFKQFFINHLFTIVCYIIIMTSSVFLLYRFIWRKKLNDILEDQQFVFYISLIFCFMYWLLSAPDVRFASGIICGTTFFIISFICGKRHIHFARLGSIMFYCTIITLSVISINRSIGYNKKISENHLAGNLYEIKDLLIRPFSSIDQTVVHPSNYVKSEMNGLTIYLTKDVNLFDKFPRFKDISPKIIAPHGKLQGIITIEARGNTLQEGFRTKKQYVNIIDSLAKELVEKEKVSWW